MLVINVALPLMLPIFASGRNPHLQDAALTTLTSSVTVTENATLTATELIAVSTDAVVIENVTVTTTRFCNTTTTSVYTTLASSTSTDAGAPSASGDNVLGCMVTAFSPNTPIDGLPMQAAGYKFWLGGEPAAYCPERVREVEACPPGNMTVVNVCSMAVTVPGGQAIYATADGQIAYTIAHSSRFPNPWKLDARCPFSYEWTGGQYGELRVAAWAFGADSLMACPAAAINAWRVMLSMPNATVPYGDISDCIKFDALTVNATEYGAWQYN